MNWDLTEYPKQVLYLSKLRDAETRHLSYGGVRKCGKSYIGRAGSILRRAWYPGSYGLIMRESLPELEANHVDKLKQQANEFGYEWKFNVNDNVFEFPQFKRGVIPSKIYLGYGQTVDQVKRYQGNPYLDILYDETTNLMDEVVKRTNGSLANEYWPDTVSKSCYVFNPGGVGDEWVLRDLVEENTRFAGAFFIEASIHDNPEFLRNDPKFYSNLIEEYRDYPHVVEAWVKGNWNAKPGAFFVFDHTLGGKHIREVQVPYHAKFYGAFDYGHFPDPFAGVWAARWKDDKYNDHIHFMAEVYQTRLELDEQADAVNEKEDELEAAHPFFPPASKHTGKRRIIRYTGPDSNKKIPGEREKGPTRTIRYVWSKHGFVTQAVEQHSRATGWGLWRYLQKHGIMTISPTCHALIKEMKNAQYAKTAQGVTESDLDPRTGDHALDAGRYLIVPTFGLKYIEEHKKTLKTGIRTV